MNAKFDNRYNYRLEAEASVLMYLKNCTNYKVTDCRDEHTSYDIIINDTKADIKRMYYKDINKIKIAVGSIVNNKWIKDCGLYKPNNECDVYIFVDKDNLNDFVIVRKDDLIKTIENHTSKDSNVLFSGSFDNKLFAKVDLDSIDYYSF